MIKTNEIRHKRRCVFNININLVFITKYKKCIFEKHHFDYMKKIFSKTCEDFDSKLIEFNGEKDHIHLLVNYPPMVSISRLVNSLKGVSSRLLRKNFLDLDRYFIKNALWSPSYFAGSYGGVSIDTIKKYIQKQNNP